jgi:hypothetical protein
MENGKKVTVILDGSNHGLRLIFGCKKEETPEEAYQLWRYYFIGGLFQFIEKFNADELIIALDSRKNWRKKEFKYYKAHRKILRDEEDEVDHWFNFEEYYEQYDRLLKDIADNLPIKVLKVETAEADDIAGVLTKHESLENNMKILITTDKDYLQLLSNPLVRIYNPIKKEFMTCDDPKAELMQKIMLGDKGDFVPSIKDKHIFKDEFIDWCVKEGIADNEHNVRVKFEADEDLMIWNELKFQKKYGIKPSRIMAFPKKQVTGLIKTDTIQDFLKENPELKKKFLRNNKLVNLTAQPKDLKEEINETYENYKMCAGLNKLFEFFIFNSFNEFMEDTTRIGNLLEPLCE